MSTKAHTELELEAEAEAEAEGATTEAIGGPWGGVSDRPSSCCERMHSYALFFRCKLT